MYKLKDRYKFPKTTGVYKIYFEGNTKFYIGSTFAIGGFYSRWMSHISQLSKNKSKLKKLQLAFNKYSKTNDIIFEIIEECDRSNCLEREQYYIDLYDSYNNGYNSRKLASNNGGVKMSDESKNNIGSNWKKLRDNLYTQVYNLYNSGKSTRDICKIMNISRTYLRRIVTENNIEMRNDRGHKKKKIYRYENYILKDEWESINSCSRDLKFNSRGIFCVLSGQCIHYKGFFFSYKKLHPKEVEEIELRFKIKSKNVKFRDIKQINVDGELIKTWNNVNEIIEFLGIKRRTGLYDAIKKNLIYRNFYWRI